KYSNNTVHTRRSSDLSAMQIENEETEKEAETKKNIRIGKLELLKILTISNLNFVQQNNVPNKKEKEEVLKKLLKELDTRLKIVEDRKSTRLNSSHVSI